MLINLMAIVLLLIESHYIILYLLRRLFVLNYHKEVSLLLLMKRILLCLVLFFCGKMIYAQGIGVELIGGYNIGDSNSVLTKGINLRYEFTPYLSVVGGLSHWNYPLKGEWLKEDDSSYLFYSIVEKDYTALTPSLGIEGSLPFLENKIHSLGFMGRIMSYNQLSSKRSYELEQQGFIITKDPFSSDDSFKLTVEKVLSMESNGAGSFSLAFMGGLYYRYKSWRINLTVEQNGIDLYYDLRKVKLDDDIYMRNLLSSPGMILWCMSFSYNIQF